MQILFVEDNSSYADTLISVVNVKLPGVSWDVVDNSGSAEELLARNFYDLVILDLCMPSIPSGLEKNVENGQRLFYKIQKLMPGTPIYILTGSDLDNFVTGLSRHGERVRLWGAKQEFPTVLYFRKNKTLELVDELSGVYGEILSVNSISINTRGKAIAFAKGQERALKTFVRSMGGHDGVYYPLSGLSGSLVGRIEVRDARLNIIGAFVAKLGITSKIKKENESYARHVRLLPINTFTPLLSEVDKGLKEYSAIFYTLAEGYTETLFEVVRRDAGAAVGVIQKVRASLERWNSARDVLRVSVGDVRKAKLSDENFEEIIKRYGIEELRDIESIHVSASVSCIHGDLHGGNILVNKTGAPVLIDFGDVESGYTGLDPITLEMSLIFHPDCVLSGISKEIRTFLEHWPIIDGYCQNNPFGDVVKYCRDWAYDISGDDRSVLAAGYAFAIRQLKYDTVNPDDTIALIMRIANALKG
ncbi:TPA: phosphotransferase [Pseudomonas aeruginosa]|uniref:response regulator n=1 Tax=Pseudomonas aeruginosa TaxID=287 RepID=UPI001CBAC5A8|nr:response regulator [Pseudomonas aeruginosa]HCF6817524.1 phosphotransferase [Pseudomonas aeruginosa]HCF6819415.1 phosphotransferase [Pseudomonas aeruginosa]HDQ4452314.1 phosphotransferase [Pseudomonas aeruginosa]HDQ4454541.1 phosphotransferase [Pseudomonas aeruginosa]